MCGAMGYGLWRRALWKCWGQMGAEKRQEEEEVEMKKRRGKGWSFLLGAEELAGECVLQAGEDNRSVRGIPEYGNRELQVACLARLEDPLGPVLSQKQSSISDQTQVAVSWSLKLSPSRKPSRFHSSLEHRFSPFLPVPLALRHPQRAACPPVPLAASSFLRCHFSSASYRRGVSPILPRLTLQLE